MRNKVGCGSKMSHFVVGVIRDLKTDQTVDELLEPYMENSAGTPDYRYMEFYDVEEECRLNYGTDTIDMLRSPDDKIIFSWSKEAPKTHAGDELPEGWVNIKMPAKVMYPTMKDYIENFCGYTKDPVEDKYGYWQNPNAKWDWYEIGGRWDGYFDGANIINVKDYDTAIDIEVYNARYKEWKEWEGGKEFSIDENFDFAFYNPEYLKSFYKNAETYARVKATPWMRAIITPDGEWHEVGEMGWWGYSDETGDDMLDWVDHFAERFILPYSNGDYEITAVDCHI